MERPLDAACGATRWPAVFELLASIWPRLRTAIPTAARLGAQWDRMSTPFVVADDDRVLAHTGVLEIPMVLNGRDVAVAGLHAVCTAPDARGRGLARRVIEAAIEHCAAHETLVLHANDPAVYHRFGFRALEQAAFVVEIERATKAPPMRRLAADVPADVVIVHRAFATRTPVSHVLGIGAAAELFVLDEVLGCNGFGRLWWAEDLAAVVACDLDDDRVLQIYDIVAPRLPSVADIVARIDRRVDRVEVMFVPDRLAERTRPRALHPLDVLMVRGPFVDAQSIIVPPLARC